jgi:hypothetical protein
MMAVQIWELFEIWYGGGPAISVVGPPIEDTRRWTVHVYERAAEDKEGESLVELVAKLEHPEDLVHKESKDGKETRVTVKLQGRRPTVSELTFLSKTADFYDGEGDKAERGLSAVDSDEEAENDDEEEEDDDDEEDLRRDAASESSGGASAAYAPLTAAHLELLSADDEENDDGDNHVVATTAKKEDVKQPPKEEDVKPAPKLASIFGRIK